MRLAHRCQGMIKRQGWGGKWERCERTATGVIEVSGVLRLTCNFHRRATSRQWDTGETVTLERLNELGVELYLEWLRDQEIEAANVVMAAEQEWDRIRDVRLSAEARLLDLRARE